MVGVPKKQKLCQADRERGGGGFDINLRKRSKGKKDRRERLNEKLRGRLK